MSESSQAGPGADQPARNGVSGFLRGRPHARWSVGVVGLLVAVGLVVAWWYYAGRETTDDAQVDGHIVPIAARVGGTVAAVKVEDNQIVEAGAILVEIDPRDYEVARQPSRGRLRRCAGGAGRRRGGHPDHVDDDRQPGQFGRRERRAGDDGDRRRPRGTSRRRARGWRRRRRGSRRRRRTPRGPPATSSG